jgi:glycosyltransferase involved in cell wall biosynthesis
MKVGLLTSWISHGAGGMFDVIRSSVQSLGVDPNIRIAVFGLKDGVLPSFETRSDPPIVCALPARGPRAWGYAPSLPSALAAADLDLLHVHGIWMYYSVACLHWARATRRPYILSPHGMLDPWALRNSRWKKRAALWVYEKRNLQRATCLHALCKAEAQAIRELGLRNPICIIPNGLEIPDPVIGREPVWRNRLPRSAKILLYLGRLHPKKGLINLLHAWQRVDRAEDGGRSDWHLVIAGWDQIGHESELRKLANLLDIEKSVHFVGPVFGIEKDSSFGAATAFVLPSVSEGLPMVVLEAWSHGLPVLMTKYCNLPEGVAANAALEIATDSEGICRGLHILMRMPEDQRSTIGENGRRLCRERFSLEASSGAMKLVYRWLVSHGPRPDCVTDD